MNGSAVFQREAEHRIHDCIRFRKMLYFSQFEGGADTFQSPR